jgi:siroheme synthase-like protein
MSTSWYPVNLLLEGQRALVVGGGERAASKVSGLLNAGAAVTVVAPHVVDGLRDGRIRCHQREYRRGEAASYALAIAATGLDEVDRQVAADAHASHIPVNVVDRPALCSFTLPAVHRHGDLQIAVSTNGRSPAFASWARTRLAHLVDEHLVTMLEVAAEVRDELHAVGRSSELAGWHDALDRAHAELMRSRDRDAAKMVLLASLGVVG